MLELPPEVCVAKNFDASTTVLGGTILLSDATKVGVPGVSVAGAVGYPSYMSSDEGNDVPDCESDIR